MPQDMNDMDFFDFVGGFILTVVLVGVLAFSLSWLFSSAESRAQADPVPVYVEGDFDFDEDVDLYDFAVFQRNFTGEGIGGPQ